MDDVESPNKNILCDQKENHVSSIGHKEIRVCFKAITVPISLRLLLQVDDDFSALYYMF